MPTTLHKLDDGAFETRVLSNDTAISVVIFTLPWSGGSQLLRGIVAQLVEDGGTDDQLHFFEMDADNSPHTRNRFRIGFIPTTLIFRGAELVHQIKGVVSKHTFAQLLQPLLTTPIATTVPSRGRQV